MSLIDAHYKNNLKLICFTTHRKSELFKIHIISNIDAYYFANVPKSVFMKGKSTFIRGGGQLNSRLLHLIKSFLLLFLFTCIGIFLHELSHHLSGIPSILSLSRNYPLVPISNDNIKYALINNLVGPATNLLLAYIGLIVYMNFEKNKTLNSFGMFLGISNCFIALSGAVINLIVDVLSGNMGNDLEVAASILGINILILPAIFSFLSLIPFITFWRDSKKVTPDKISFIAIIFIAWLTGGAFLMTLDSIFTIRISLYTLIGAL